MDRKSQIFAPVRKVAGVRVAFKQATSSNSKLKPILDSMKKEMTPTKLTSCSYKSGKTIYSYENANIKSIFANGNKYVGLIVTGDVKEMDEESVMKDIPEDLSKAIQEISSMQDGEEPKKDEE